MFLTADQVKNIVNDIITDDFDNDVAFIVAHKGIGKTKLLQEIYASASSNDQIIVANGKSVVDNSSTIKRCFAEGIIKYILRHNSFHIRKKLCSILGLSMTDPHTIRTIFRRKLDIERLGESFCKLSLKDLKNVYYKLAGETPLVIVSTATVLTDEEIHYIKELPNDQLGRFGAKSTFVISIRATSQNLNVVNEILKAKPTGIWLLPLLPEIEKESSEKNPYIISSISVGSSGVISNLYEIQQKLIANPVYFDLYEIVNDISNNSLNLYLLFILAYQEVSLSNYAYLCDLSKKVFNRKVLDGYDNRLVLPNNEKLLWLDALSYFYILQNEIDVVINEIQVFFLGIIREIVAETNQITFDKASNNAFISFIKDASVLKKNSLANGLANYYSDFSSLTKALYSLNSQSNQGFFKSLDATNVLNRATIVFSNDNIYALQKIYEKTQLCFILDIGLNTINTFIHNLQLNCDISVNKQCIENFLRLCLLEAYKWHDITLMEGIAKVGLSIKANHLSLRFRFNELTSNTDMIELSDYFTQLLKKYDLKLGDVIMPKGTIFLSYTQKNVKIADRIDSALQEKGYSVKRDIRDVEKWGNLKEFMNTIRKEDFVVFLVSDVYLRRKNCLYEVMQFLKDESYEKRAFPIVINFSEEEKEERLKSGHCTSMFDTEYRTEIVLFWQNRADDLEKQVNKLSPENRAESDAEFREIKNMAQSASEFLNKFFGERLLMTIDTKRPQYKSIVTEIDQKIQSQF